MDSVVLKKESTFVFEGSDYQAQCTPSSTQSPDPATGSEIRKKCGEIFISKDDLFNFLCTLCESSFEESERFFVHVKGVHSPEKRYNIEKSILDDSFEPNENCYLEKTNFESSARIVAIDEIKVEIPECTEQEIDPLCITSIGPLIEEPAKINVNPSQITAEKNLHNSAKLFKCDICSLTCKTKSILHGHKKRHGEKKFPCEYCDKSFFNAKELRYHGITHTSEKPYRCNVCKEVFTSTSALDHHNKKHLDVRRHKCQYCNKGFLTLQKLKFHLIIHRGEKRSILKKHEKINPNIQKFKCSQKEAQSTGEPDKQCESSDDKHEGYNLSFRKKEKIKNVVLDEKDEICNLTFRTSYKEPDQQCGMGLEEDKQENDDFVVQSDCDSETIGANRKVSMTKINDMKMESSQSTKETVDLLSIIPLMENLEKGESSRNTSRPQVNEMFSDNDSTSSNVKNEKPQVCYEANSSSTEKDSLKEEASKKNESGGESSKNKSTIKFKCPDCDTKFSSRRSLNRHLENPMRCVRKATSNSQVLAKKLNTAQLAKRKCSYCDRIFSTFKHRLVHERLKHTGELPFQCNVCKKRFAIINALKRHEKSSKCKDKEGIIQEKQQVESANKNLTKIEESLNKTENHYLNKEPNEENKSSENECGEDSNNENNLFLSIKEESELYEELKNRDEPDQQSYKCEICGKLFGSHCNLQKHEAQTMCRLIKHILGDVRNGHNNESSSTQLEPQAISGSDNTKQKTQCKFCDIEVNSREDLIRHLKSSVGCLKKAVENQHKPKILTTTITAIIASTEKRKCRYCDRLFSETRRRIEHERIHTGEKPYQCRFCGRLFRVHSHVYTHEKTHTVAEQLKCDICNLTFKTKCILNGHKKRHGIKAFLCQYCDKSFFNAKELKFHERTHTGEKPYKCNFCEQAFASSSALNYHNKKHLDIRPHKCQYCNIACHTLQKLKCHLITHTGEKPYACPVCDAKFGRSSCVLKHGKVHAGIKEFVCKICRTTTKEFRELLRHVKSHNQTETN